MIPEQIFLIVLDGLGVGAAKDAAAYGDAGSNTLKSLLSLNPHIPFLKKMGILEILEDQNNSGSKNSSNSNLAADLVNAPIADHTLLAKLSPKSKSKDTLGGHWEMMEYVHPLEFAYFPDGFPQNMLDELIQKTQGTGFLGNIAASGTQIIQQYGLEHIQTLKPILYTSQDSVMQIAAHEKYFGLENLKKICEDAAQLFLPPLGRIIARPFLGETAGSFYRTSNRHDFALKPDGPVFLENKELHNKAQVISFGKIKDIFSGLGQNYWVKTVDNADSYKKLLQLQKNKTTDDALVLGDDQGQVLGAAEKQLIFVNLNDFDTLYGHRRDLKGFAKALEDADQFLQQLQQNMGHSDYLILTADHGNDPMFSGSDHTRENVPLLIYGQKISRQKISTNKNSVVAEVEGYDLVADVLKKILQLDAIALNHPSCALLDYL